MSAPWMPLYIGDYLKDTRRLTAQEHGAYLLLIMEYWQHGCVPIEDDALARIACLLPSEWKLVRKKIAPYFTTDWRHTRIDAELAKAEGKSNKARTSAKRRWADDEVNPPPSPSSERSADGAANANANALPSHSENTANGDARAMLMRGRHNHSQNTSLPSQEEKIASSVDRFGVINGGLR